MVGPSRSSTAKPELASVACDSACQPHKGLLRHVSFYVLCTLRLGLKPQTWRRIDLPQVSKKWLLAFTGAKTAYKGRFRKPPAVCFRSKDSGPIVVGAEVCARNIWLW